MGMIDRDDAIKAICECCYMYKYIGEHYKDCKYYPCDDVTALEAVPEAPSGDLISRADAIEAVCGDCTIENRESCKRDGYCYEVRNLMALPSAEAVHGDGKMIPIELKKRYPHSRDEDITDAFMRGYQAHGEAVQGWIPCSEKLPEKDELVLVTVWNDVSIAWRNIYGGWESAEDMYEKGDVTAWMPLPKPYKGGDDE